MTDTATPRPWYVGAQNDGLFVIDKPPRPVPADYPVDIPDVTLIASIDGYRPADAALIVTAVNEYDALKAVEAAARGAVTLASQGLTPHIQLQAISDTLAALDAIRKQEVAR